MLNRPLLSNQWYRVAALTPRLRAHVQVHRHVYRGQIWYVIEDRLGGRHHRFNFAAYRVLNLMDGQRSLAQTWAALSEHIDDDTPTQDDIVQLLGQLHSADLVLCDVTPDVAELLERRSRQRRQKWMGRIGNPVALRVPLFDPDVLLEHCVRVLRPLGGRIGVLLWLALVLPALVLALAHGPELTRNFAEQWLGAGNLLLLALLFPVVKAVHELGHGIACKIRGGEVHEAGLMLLAFYPVPYVDVSNASAFAGKWQRALVGAAGMLAELWIAALAFYVWLVLEPGLARSIAYNVAVMASVTTLFFNANPLLRYDGYYILCDVIETPNLAQRANKQWQYWVERFAFGVRQAEPPPATPGERRWFLGYAPLSYVYRLFVALVIAMFVAQQFFLIGVVLAVWTVGLSVLWPIFKGFRALATGPQFVGHGTRVRAVLAGTAMVVGLSLFALPLPHHTNAEGVLWLPERAILRAGGGGFISTVLVAPGQVIEAGQPVVQAVDPGLVARIEAQRARLDEVQAQYDAAWGSSQARATQLDEEVRREAAVLARLEDEAARLTLRTEVAGTLVIDHPHDLPGRFARKGEVLGYVRTGEAPLVRAVVTQADIDAVRLGTRSVSVRLDNGSTRTWPARLVRSVPAAVRQLPSAVLGTHGGGSIAVDPRDTQGLGTVESVFEFELELPLQAPHEHIGARAHVRFEHAAEPIGWRWVRALRRAFLSQFHV